ncbi:glycine zipper 2TM domain-containing protein [Thermomonas sp. HDW16]|uniref:glycine zipper 2TM domain-containing protein n=1 Tax=Thermomonas sp. HDW16 TaxID=2714945 RepID=UPI00140BCB1C|nr:glycine zipper 2TM domain-containing protein [Thermomonas sp. HDW16]QIL20070.1 glycine zipper 2TM domain-containing protein [Thermomonas sp. HDW16]
MKRLSAALLAIGLVSSSAAFAQSGYDPSRSGYGNGYEQGDSYTDYARVIRVDPVLDGRYSSTSSYNRNGQRCYQNTTAGSYERDGDYGNNGYRNDGYRDDGYYRDQYGNPQYGSGAGRNIATVVGGIAGAVLGSKVGSGTGSYVGTAVGSMVGGMAGRQIYDQTQRNRYVRPSTVRVCDPEPVRDGYDSYRTNDSRANAYDVTYEYNGRRYTRRMDHHPGDRVRVRVDVSPQ